MRIINVPAILILLLSIQHGYSQKVDINGQFHALKPRAKSPEKWHTYIDAKAEGQATFKFVQSNDHSDKNSFRITNKSQAGSASLCLTRPVKRDDSRVSYKLSGYIKSEQTTGVIYVNIYSIDKKTRKKRWGHALIRDGGDHGWLQKSISFSLPRDASGFGVNLILNGSGNVWFKDFNLTQIPNSSPVGAPSDEDQFLVVESVPSPPNPLSGLFVHQDPDSVLYGMPRQLVLPLQESVNLTLARNEKSGFPVSIFSSREVTSKVTLPEEIDYGSIKVEPIHFWAQRRSDKTDSDAVIRAELIGEKPDDLQRFPTQRKTFWVAIDGNKYKQPGKYQESITFLTNDTQYNLELNITIQPFALLKTGNEWGLWVDSNRWRTWERSEILNEMKQISEIGITTLILSDPGSNKKGRQDEMVDRVIDWDLLDLVLSEYSNARFSAPAIISLQNMVRRINAFLKKPSYTMDAENLVIVREVFKKINNQWPDATLFLDDEINRKSIEQRTTASITYALAGEMGIKTFTTMTRIPMDNSKLPLADYTSFNGHAAAGSNDLLLWNATLDRPTQWYGSGTYQSQEGTLYPNRMLTGFLNWKLDSQFHGTWTFQRPDLDPYNDFDGKRKDWCLAYPHPLANTSIYTVQWEAIRLGINDYRYLETCQLLIQQALEDDRTGNDQIAKQANDFISELKAEIPWFYGQNVGGEKLNGWRLTLSNFCLQLVQ